MKRILKALCSWPPHKCINHWCNENGKCKNATHGPVIRAPKEYGKPHKVNPQTKPKRLT